MDGVEEARLERAERLLAEAEDRLAEAELEAAQAEVARLERDEARAQAEELARRIEVLEADATELRGRVERAARVHAEMQESVSWKVTAPLRRAAARGRRGG